MKSKKELNALKKEVEILNKKFAELTEEELAEVTGGIEPTLTKSWFSVADLDAGIYPDHIKAIAIHKGKTLLPGGEKIIRIKTNYPLPDDE